MWECVFESQWSMQVPWNRAVQEQAGEAAEAGGRGAGTQAAGLQRAARALLRQPHAGHTVGDSDPLPGALGEDKARPDLRPCLGLRNRGADRTRPACWGPDAAHRQAEGGGHARPSRQRHAHGYPLHASPTAAIAEGRTHLAAICWAVPCRSRIDGVLHLCLGWGQAILVRHNLGSLDHTIGHPCTLDLFARVCCGERIVHAKHVGLPMGKGIIERFDAHFSCRSVHLVDVCMSLVSSASCASVMVVEYHRQL
jgi:hypothetical protein